jgi:hypothetical protein
MRYVPWTRLRKDEDDNVLGFLGDAFKLKPNEDHLSVNWLEYFDGDRDMKIQASVSRLRPECLHLVSRFVRREQE